MQMAARSAGVAAQAIRATHSSARSSPAPPPGRARGSSVSSYPLTPPPRGAGEQSGGAPDRGVEGAANRPSVMFPAQVKRMATPLQGFLKGQFGLIADQVTALILATGRGGGEKLKLRVMRETVAQIRTALEMAASKVKTQHAVQIETAGGD